jgi:hydrogenase maturation protein HypF
MEARELLVTGAVQGVGFRPFAYRLAHELSLGGLVRNDARGVFIRITGPATALETFVTRIRRDAAPPIRVETVTLLRHETNALHEPFQIVVSDANGQPEAIIMADLATCPACLRELNWIPATGATAIPSSTAPIAARASASSRAFPTTASTPRCAGSPNARPARPNMTIRLDRRFHAQPNACPVCGPRVAWWNPAGESWPRPRRRVRKRPSRRCARVPSWRSRGLGGFHLMCDARSNNRRCALRARKRREEKPFALMAPASRRSPPSAR